MPCMSVNVVQPTEISINEVAKGLPTTISVGSAGTTRSIVVTITSNKSTSISLRLTSTINGKTIHDKTYTVNISSGTNDYFIDNINIPGASGTLTICAYTSNTSKCKNITVTLTKPDIRVTDIKIIYNGKVTTTIPPNEVFTVQATLTNYGETGTCYYKLTIDGNVITTNQITLNKGESKTVSMQTRISTEGTHKVCVDTQC